MQADITWKHRQTEKLELYIAQQRGKLVPIPMVVEWFGAFGSQVRLHLVGLGQRVARGDRELQDRIDREVEIAIDRTLQGAAAILQHRGEQIAEQLQREDDSLEEATDEQ
jgi:hypothetical protein